MRLKTESLSLEIYNLSENASTKTEREVEIKIFGPIGQSFFAEEANSAERICQEIADIDCDLIRLSINSPGGDAFEGVTIMNTLVKHKARVIVEVDGMAASAGSIIAMAGDEIIMNQATQIMVHGARSAFYGTASEMRERADFLDKISDDMAGVYARRTKRPKAEWVETMSKDTWFSAEEAVEIGLADRLGYDPDKKEDDEGAESRASFDQIQMQKQIYKIAAHIAEDQISGMAKQQKSSGPLTAADLLEKYEIKG